MHANIGGKDCVASMGKGGGAFLHALPPVLGSEYSPPVSSKELDFHRQKKMNLNANLTPCTKVNSKGTMDLNISNNSIELPKET